MILTGDEASVVSSPYLNAKEAADYLRLSESTIRKWVSQKRIPFRNHGARVVFYRPDLDAWSASGAREPIDCLSLNRDARKKIDEMRRHL